MWGYGHRFHKSAATAAPVHGVQEDEDPWVRRLIPLAEELWWDGVRPACVRTIGRLPNIAWIHHEEQGQTPSRFMALVAGRDPGSDRTVARA